MLKPRLCWKLADVGGLYELDRRSDASHPFSSTSRSHFRWADTFRARSLRVRFLRLSIGGWTWFCSFTDGLEACSKNWITSCTGDGSEEITSKEKKIEADKRLWGTEISILWVHIPESLSCTNCSYFKQLQTWIGFLQIFLQQLQVQNELEPGGQRWCGGSAASDRLPVCGLGTHLLDVFKLSHK